MVGFCAVVEVCHLHVAGNKLQSAEFMHAHLTGDAMTCSM